MLTENKVTPAAAPTAPQAEGKPTGEAAKKLIDEAYKAWQRSDESERERRTKYKKNLRMLTMQQWEDKDKNERDLAGRPVMTDDRLTPAVQAIVNSARENRPSAKVHPINAESDEDTAQVIEGGIRHIEYASQAAISYDTAFESAVGRGWGYWRVTTDYCDDGSFDNQEVKIEPIPNTLTVYPDESSVKGDGSDMMKCCVLHIWTHERYIEKYGGKDDLVVRGFQATNEDSVSQWVNAETVTLCEYWRVKLIPKTKVLVERWSAESNNIVHVVFDDIAEYQAKNAKPGDVVLKTRPWDDRKVEQFFLTCDEVKEYRVFPCKWIPIIRVTAKEIYDAEGKLQYDSAIEHAIPAQQLLNVTVSFKGEAITLAGRPKWVGAIGSMKTNANAFKNHNRSNITMLEYDPVQLDANGTLAPPPQWVTFDPHIEFCLATEQSAIQSIQATTMVFDPELGHNSSPNQSGRAINALQQKSQQGNFHFYDNLTRAQWHSYRIIIDLIPKIYDTPREIGWLGADQKRSVIKVNQEYVDPETGKTKTHMLDAGNYGIIVDPGPSYDTQRLEAQAFLEQAMQQPLFLEKCADLIVQLRDLGPLGDRIAERVAPPGYGKTDQDDPVKMKQALAQFTQQSQAMSAKIHELMQEKEAKLVEKQADFQKAKMQEEHADYRAITTAEITAKTALGLAEGKQAQDVLAKRLGYAHEVGMHALEHAGTAIQSEQAHSQSQEQAAQGHSQNQEMAQTQADLAPEPVQTGSSGG